MAVLIRADYSNPNWTNQATDLLLDVHGGVGIGAIDPPNTLQRTDRPFNYRRFMFEPEAQDPAAILGIASFGLTLASRNILFISEFFIPRTIRRMGHGTTLMELIEAQARIEDKDTLLLQSLETSLGFYASLGFTRAEREDDRPFLIKRLTDL